MLNHLMLAISVILFVSVLFLRLLDIWTAFSVFRHSERGDLDEHTGKRNPIEAIEKAYKMHPERPFYIQFSDGRFLIFPRQFATQIANLSEDIVDARQAQLEHFYPKYTFPRSPDLQLYESQSLGVKVLERCLKSFTSRVGLLRESEPYWVYVEGQNAAALASHAERIVREEFPSSNDWVELCLYPKLLRICAVIINTVFLPPSLYRDETISTIEIEYMKNLLHSAIILQHLPERLHPIVQYLIPPLRRLRRAHFSLVSFCRSKESELLEEIAKFPCLLSQYNDLLPRGAKISDRMAEGLIMGSLVAFSTTTGALHRAICELSERQDCIDVLREEINEVTSGSSSTIDVSVANSLVKLDSFLKETHRLNPGSLLTLRRKARKDFNLGPFHIPKGATIALPLRDISRDPEVYEDALTFKPLRFYQKRYESRNSQNDYSSINADSLVFGLGRHACPGRHLASTVIKLVLAVILRDYDIALAEGHDKKPRTIAFGSLLELDMDVPLRVRKRR